MDKARIYVDFNELVDDNIVLLSKSDTKIDSKGNIVTFYEGMPISVYSDDIDENGEIDNLIAEGIARKQNLGGNWQEMWCCHMEPNSMMHESDKIKKARIYWFSEEEGGRKGRKVSACLHAFIFLEGIKSTPPAVEVQS